VARWSPDYWRVTIDNPPVNVMGPEMVKQFQEVINALEADKDGRRSKPILADMFRKSVVMFTFSPGDRRNCAT
jgi:hypothetical protein